MKKAIICPICHKPKKESDTYALKLTDYTTPVILDSANNKYSFPERKVRICRTDAKRMGYKTKTVKKVVKPRGDGKLSQP